MGEVRYARSRSAHVAYRIVNGSGRGTRDVVLLTSGTLPMDAMFEDPVALRFVEGLADLGRLVLFDRSGIGLSDPPRESDTSTLARWAEDLEAVVHATEVVDPVLVCVRLGAGAAFVYCVRHPDTVSALVLFEPPSWRGNDWDILRRQIEGEVDSVALWCPSRAEDPGFREWFTRAGQRGASPGRAAGAYPDMSEGAGAVIEDAATRVRTPTVVLRRPAHSLSPSRVGDEILELMPGAVRVDLPGEDLFPFGGEVDALIAEIARFVTGDYRAPVPERELAAVLFTDIVSSTARASALGDARWKRLLDRHDEVSRSCIGRRGGAVIKSTGDGVLATFPSATSALHAAQDLRAALREEELDVRASIHVGDIDRRGDDISGINVVISARMLGVAGSGDILMSSTALAATGDLVPSELRGNYEFKGVQGTWSVYSITDA
jgi:class 3 adenylate cyclase/pimeloyl-ACP methyl ester carboxylesterase